MLFSNNLYNIIFAFYVILCLLLLMYYYSKEKFELSKKPNKELKYLLWNGDYKSTYRLAELLIDEKTQVQPLYIKINLEDCKTSLTTCKLKELKFKNNNYELKIMNKIINKLKNNYPAIEKQGLLLPIKYIRFNELEKDKTFNEYFNELLNKNKFNQLINSNSLAKKLYIIAKYSLYNNINIDITLTKKELLSNKAFYKFISKRNKSNNEKKQIFVNNLNFLLLKTSKTQMNKKFNDITQLSWSCTNINTKTGNNCGKCNKCISINQEHPSSYI
jgi:hypothetical protein